MIRSSAGHERRSVKPPRFLRWLESQTGRDDEIGSLARNARADAARYGLDEVEYLARLGSQEIEAPRAREALFEAMMVWVRSEESRPAR
jgi:hypothetical protein